DFIKKETHIQQKWSRSLSKYIADPTIHGLLQGKFNQANELGITMDIQPESQLTHPFSEKQRDAFLTAFGNLLENAMEAVKKSPDAKREISIFFTDIGEDVVVEVDDSGHGVKEENIKYNFEQRFSTKEDSERDTGLALMKQVIQKVDGAVMLEEGELGGVCFVIIIPKTGGDADEK